MYPGPVVREDPGGSPKLSREASFEKIALYAAVVLIVCLGLSTFCRLLGIRITIWDDAGIALATHQNTAWQYLFGYAREQGRIQFFLGMPVWALALNYEHSACFDVLHYGVLLLAHVAFFLVLRLYATLRFALMAALVYCSSLALTWDHNLLVSVPLFTFGIMLFGFVALILLYVYMRFRRPYVGLLSLYALGISFFGHEYVPLLFFTAYLVCGYSLDDRRESGLRGFRNAVFSRLAIKALGLLLFYECAYLVYRFISPSKYAGNSLSMAGFHLRGFFSALFQFSLSSSIFAYLFRPYEFPYWDEVGHSMFHYTTALPVVGVWELNNLRHFVVMALVAAAGGLLVSGKDRLPRKSALVLGAVGLLVMFLPNTLTAVTSKYQQWAESGVRAYQYTTISHFGFALLLSASYQLARHYLDRIPALSMAFRSVFVCVLAIASLWASYANSVVAHSMNINSDRWNSFNLLMSSPTLAKVIQQNPVVAPRLWSYFWSVPVPDTYWRDYASAKYRRAVDFRKELPPQSHNDAIFFDYARQDRCGGLFDIVIPAHESERGWQGNALYVLAAHPPRNVFVEFQIDTNSPEWVPLENAHVVGSHGYLYSISAQNLDIDSVRVGCVPENHSLVPKLAYNLGTILDFRTSSVNHFLGRGWSHQESFGIWTDGPETDMKLVLVEPPSSDLILSAVLSPFLAGTHQKLDVEVHANDRAITTWRFSQAGLSEQTARIPREIFASSKTLQLSFRILQPASPVELGLS